MSTTVTLERYAEMRAEIEAGRLRGEVLARAGVTSDEWTVAERAWLEKMGAELERGRFELTNRYTQAFLERQRAFTSAMPPAAVANAPIIEAPPPPAPTAAPAPSPFMPLPPVPAAILPVAESIPIIPLRIEVQPAQVQQPIVPMGMDPLMTTVDMVPNAGKHDALPFKQDPWDNASPISTIDIVLDDEEEEHNVLPFKKATTDKGSPTDTTVATTPPSEEVMKRVQSISLAQYADICATIRAFPDQVVQIRDYYRMDLPTWTALHRVWQERFTEDPPLRSRWEALVQMAMAKRAR